VSPEPDSDRILAAQLQGTAKRHAKWRELAEDEHGGPRWESCASSPQGAPIFWAHVCRGHHGRGLQ
jgi:hypothetical protein